MGRSSLAPAGESFSGILSRPAVAHGADFGRTVQVFASVLWGAGKPRPSSDSGETKKPSLPFSKLGFCLRCIFQNLAIRNRLPSRTFRSESGPMNKQVWEWTEPGSNRRHQDFQSCALPTELSVRRFRNETVEGGGYRGSRFISRTRGEFVRFAETSSKQAHSNDSEKSVQRPRCLAGVDAWSVAESSLLFSPVARCRPRGPWRSTPEEGSATVDPWTARSGVVSFQDTIGQFRMAGFLPSPEAASTGLGAVARAGLEGATVSADEGRTLPAFAGRSAVTGASSGPRSLLTTL